MAQAENPLELIVIYWVANASKDSQKLQIDVKTLGKALVRYQLKHKSKSQRLSQVPPCLKTPGKAQAFAALLLSIAAKPELSSDSISLFFDLLSTELVKPPDVLLKDYGKTTSAFDK